jgi:hypothetical protein
MLYIARSIIECRRLSSNSGNNKCILMLIWIGKVKQNKCIAIPNNTGTNKEGRRNNNM